MSNAFSLHKHDTHHAGSATAGQQHQSTSTSAASSKPQQNGAYHSTTTQASTNSSRFQPLYPPESSTNNSKIITSTGAAKPSVLAAGVSAPSKQVQQAQPLPQPATTSIKPPPAPTKHVAPVITEEEQTTVVQDSSPDNTTSIHSKGITFTIDKRYTQLKVIGKGAYGVVVSGYDTVEKRRVAIKKSLHAFDNLLLSRRLLRELILLRQLNHENIIRLYDLQKPSTVKNWNEVYMVTDLMETDLNQIIKSEQPLTIEHAQFFMYQMIRGMKYIHSAGILHRDLKPSNILINSNCDIKICDLGLARAFDYGDISEGNKLTEYVVTRWYRSPELLLNDKMYTISVDIWSLGCIMAELFVRKPLFQGRNYLDQLNKIIYVMGYPTSSQIRSMTMSEAASKNLSQIPRYPKLNLNDLYKHAKIPSDALDLIDKMLAFSPADRITAEQALEHPFFEGLHNPEDEPVADFKVDLSFEKEANSVEAVKRLLYKEILRYHPNPPGTPDPFILLERYDSESSDEEDELSPIVSVSPSRNGNSSESSVLKS